MASMAVDRITPQRRDDNLDELRDELERVDWMKGIGTEPGLVALTASRRRSPTGRARGRRPAPRWSGYGR
jgi:hypothetical protein